MPAYKREKTKHKDVFVIQSWSFSRRLVRGLDRLRQAVSCDHAQGEPHGGFKVYPVAD